ncbi:response regulator transcription factor [Eisenbergiella tayi]|uniref:response regulator transcription factor n=1 Tax=Eisenbergiella tayi TaxID=1432052 RepID=UPI000848B71D|nr:response regulator [Eisenbergiella tayi]ODR28293.1 hypothetical protein BEI60_31175 [Eisenbergiella tayi]
MYTILLVDDEKSVLNTLTSSIQWQQFGVEKILTATDGIQALNIMQKNHTDLLITDIRMPNMDGLELLTKVRKLYPATHCILLTAYSEFEYARQAIKLGVENYLLKPFQKNEMEETIEKSLNNIYAMRNNTDTLFLNNILLRWLNGSISNEELSERAIILNINLYFSKYCVICLKKKKEQSHLWHYCTAVAQSLSSGYDVHLLWDEKNHYAFIIGCNELRTGKLIDTFLQTAKDFHTESLFFLSIGKTVNNCNELQLSYQDACGKLNAAELSGFNDIVVNSDLMPLEDTYILQDLLKAFNLQEAELRSIAFEDIISGLLATPYMNYNRIFSQLSLNIFHLFTQEFPMELNIRNQLTNRIQTVPKLIDKESFQICAKEALEYSFLLFQLAFNQFSPIIQHVINYIQKHYSESLSIKEFCEKNKMSTPYLGYLFKKETGFFFNNYLTQYRICCAVQLLKESEIKVNELARKVGFSSTSYFIACFRKQTGLSPNKYRALQEGWAINTNSIERNNDD